jgi:hypothetical protein
VPFVRVVERDSWDVELIDEGRVLTFPDRVRAMDRARAAEPDWIELGQVVDSLGGSPRYHAWTTLRRYPDGSYGESGLGWAGPGRGRA